MENYKKHPNYQELNIDSLFQNAWEIYKKNFGWFFFYSFLVILLLQYFNSLLMVPYIEDINSITEDPEKAVSLLKNTSLIVLISIIGYTILYLFLTYLLLNPDPEPDETHFSLLGKAIKTHFLPLLGATILSGIIMIFGTVLGLFLLIIGAFAALIYFGTIFFPIIPLLIIENANPIEAISRCFRLVHSDLWKIIGWVIVFFIMYLVISLVLGALTMIPFASDFFEIVSNPTSAIESGNLINNPLQVILSSLVNALILPLMPIFAMLIYLNLKFKEDKENERNEFLKQMV